MGTRSLEASLCLSIVSGTHVPSSFILSQCRGPIARGLSEAEEEEVAAGPGASPLASAAAGPRRDEAEAEAETARASGSAPAATPSSPTDALRPIVAGRAA
jgi:hypothetical protein